MKRAARRRRGKDALELVEQAFHDLRRAPAGAWIAYAAGTLPYLLGLLYFWGDMSRSAWAFRRVAEASLGMALLFLWMKFWHALFVSRLAEGERWTLSRAFRAAVLQAAAQPSGLFAIPIAALIALPFGWVFAFYQNVTVFGDGAKARDAKTLLALSVRSAKLWPRQNHAAIVILGLFAFFVFVNIAVVLWIAPHLLRMLLGFETAFSRAGGSALNKTYFAIVLALTYLCVDPLVKAVYRIRCFETESLESAEDLKTEWSAVRPVRRALGLVLFLLALLFPANLPAQTPASPSEGPSGTFVSAPDLDRAIGRILQKREYAWRLRREPTAFEAEEGWLVSFFRSIAGFLRRAWDTVVAVWDALIEWLDRLFRRRGRDSPEPGETSGFGWILSANGLIFLLLALVLCALALLLVRTRRRRRTAASAGAPVPLAAVPREEELAADEMPEDEWQRRASRFLSLGDFRQAVRALYLGSLAFLAARGTITLARGKSNRDYERELLRRQRVRPEVPAVFAESVAAFERVWYGRHTATPETAEALSRNLDAIRTRLEG